MVSFGTIYAVCSVFMLLLTFSFAGDIVHPDNIAPRRPGCDNNFVLVMKLMKNIYTLCEFCFLVDCINAILACF